MDVIISAGEGAGRYNSSALDCWSTGRGIDPTPWAYFITFLSLAKVVPGPLQPNSAESWPKTPIISLLLDRRERFKLPRRYPNHADSTYGIYSPYCDNAEESIHISRLNVQVST